MQADNISFDTKLHCFNVKGLSGVTRVVTLFPRASCSCPSTGDCYHILAVKLNVGMSVSTKPVQRNLTQLRRNTRSRKEKRCGRKKPRPNDVELENQGELNDSVLNTCIQYTCNPFTFLTNADKIQSPAVPREVPCDDIETDGEGPDGEINSILLLAEMYLKVSPECIGTSLEFAGFNPCDLNQLTLHSVPWEFM